MAIARILITNIHYNLGPWLVLEMLSLSSQSSFRPSLTFPKMPQMTLRSLSYFDGETYPGCPCHRNCLRSRRQHPSSIQRSITFGAIQPCSLLLADSLV